MLAFDKQVQHQPQIPLEHLPCPQRAAMSLAVASTSPGANSNAGGVIFGAPSQQPLNRWRWQRLWAPGSSYHRGSTTEHHPPSQANPQCIWLSCQLRPWCW
jgi:hypothetical protein